jgi:DNA modification methylase
MAKKTTRKKTTRKTRGKKTGSKAEKPATKRSPGRPSSLLDTRVVYCGDCLEQLANLPDNCVDLIYIDPPFNSNRNYEVFWGETKEKRSFADRHASTQAYIDYMRPRCVQLSRVLKKTGSFYYHCDWHASHYVKVMLDQIFGENLFQNEIVESLNNPRQPHVMIYCGHRCGYGGRSWRYARTWRWGLWM